MSLPELAPIPTPVLIPILVPAPPFLQQALAPATLHLILAVNWEQIKKFRSILQAECMETCSHCNEWWFQLGLAMEGDNIGVCKACIKDTKALKIQHFPLYLVKAISSIQGLFLVSYLYLLW